MIDHVTIGVTDLDRSAAFYDAALAPLEMSVPHVREQFLEWGDYSISRSGGRARTQRAHVAFAARSHAHVDAFWRAAIAAGGVDNGAPGFRPHYHARYYGAYVLDPDAINVEAVFHGPEPARPGSIDHLTLRVRSPRLARRFYETVLEPIDVATTEDPLGFRRDGSTLWILEDEPTQNLHFAFAARDNAAVDAFWHAGTAAGFIDNGPPGERPQYHAGYYGAFLLDPDGNNVEAVCHNR